MQRKKQCPRCGKEFVCKHDSSCFCTKYTLSADSLKELQKQYNDCLCEDCLKIYANTSKQTQDKA